MFPNNNNNYPRTPGGYSVETYEPAVIHPDQRQKAEDLVRMAFTEKDLLLQLLVFLLLFSKIYNQTQL